MTQQSDVEPAMTEMNLLERALVATEAHSGQTDKAGELHILHSLRLMASMPTEAEQASALLHDVAEDCELWSVARTPTSLAARLARLSTH